MDIDKITVALATFRRPDFLELAVKALSDQKYPRLRLIVSDDSPNCENQRLVENLTGLESEYVQQAQRLGVIKNHLSMIRLCQSDMFMFHGDDDQILPNGLHSLSEILKTSTNYDLVFSDYLVGPDIGSAKPRKISNLLFVRWWKSENRWVRLISYYLCPTYLGKQNLFYGLYKTTSVLKIDLNKAIPRNDKFLNLDEMFAFQAVCNGRALIIDSHCYFFAEGNLKLYKDFSNRRKSVVTAVADFILYEFWTLPDYIRNVNIFAEKVALIILFPIKLLFAISWRIYRWLKL